MHVSLQSRAINAVITHLKIFPMTAYHNKMKYYNKMNEYLYNKQKKDLIM